MRNFGEEPAYCAVELAYGADFADLFAVKEARVAGAGRQRRTTTSRAAILVFRHKNGAHRRSLRVSFSEPAVLDGNVARWEVIIPSKGTWTLCQQFTCGIDDDEIEPRWLCGQPIARAKPAERHGGLAAQRARPRHRPRGPAGRGGPQRRGSRGPAHLRPRLPGADRGGGRGALVHDPVRAGLADDRLDGAARRSRAGPRDPADPGPLPGHGGQALQRGGARPHPARDALRRGVVAVARRRHDLLRDGGRHPAVRDAARRAAPLGAGPGGGRRAAARTPTGPSSGSRSSATATATATSSTSAPPTGACATRAGRTPTDAVRFADGRLGRAPDRPGRGAGLHLRRLPGPGVLRRRAGRHGARRPSCGPGPPR